MKQKLLFLSVYIGYSSLIAQKGEPVYNTFNTTRVINSHSTETLWRNELDFRVTHRFGDIAGNLGGPKAMFGLDNSSDIGIGFEYGLFNNINIGLTRYKGAGPYQQLFEGYAKYKILTQSSITPISLVAIAKTNFTAMPASKDSTSPTSFRETADRISYSYQLLIARKFGSRFSLQIMPTYVHRNFVAFQDQNGTLAIGAGFRLQLTKLFGVIGEYHYILRDETLLIPSLIKDPIAVALEINTGGHIFQLNLTNSRGFGEVQYIPSTLSDITLGQFRFGFTISRVFKL